MTRERYEPPTIQRHEPGMANKFGRSLRTPALTSIDGVSVEQLLQEHQSPLFVFSERALRRAIREAGRAFASRYPRVQFAWSYKTNYLDAICRVFHTEGALAEVVSEHEYEMARRLGVPGDSIVFNGPMKPRAALERAAAEGARIHIDHFDELYALEQIARSGDRPLEVAIRVNLDAGIYPAWDRFGFNLENGEALAAARRMKMGGSLRLAGLHAHLGTFILDPQAYAQAARKLGDFAKALRTELGFAIASIDLGGGFASKNTLHSQYAPGDEANPSLDDFAEAISSALLGAGFPPDEQPTLVLETGRALVDEAGTLLARVVANKRLPSGTRALVIDAGVNLLFTAFWYKHEFLPAVEKGGLAEDTVVYGPLCMNIDVVRPLVRLPPLDVGDPIAIRPVGAYNVNQWLQFIRMRPRVVLIGPDSEVAVIRERETIETLKALERMPEWLR